MLKLGNTAVDSLYLGETKIQKAYLGNDMVYNAQKESRLPEGYTEIRYIQSGNGQYLNTGIAGTAVAKIEMDVEPLTTSSGYFWGARTPVGTAQRRAACEKSSSSVIFRLPMTSGSTTFTIDKNTSNKRVQIVADYPNRKFMVDGTELSFSGNWYDVGHYIYLLAENYKNTGATSGTTLNAKLYSCKMYDSSGEFMKNFVPCIDPDGIPGMFDLVDKKFHKYVSGTITFIPGPAI